MQDPLSRLGYEAIDLVRFVSELELQPHASAIERARLWPDEGPELRHGRFAGYGRLLYLSVSRLPEPGIIDLFLDGRYPEPTVRPAQRLREGETLLAEGLGMGSGRDCRFCIPLWIYAAFPDVAAAIEAGWGTQPPRDGNV
jgi:hypothetical protein